MVNKSLTYKIKAGIYVSLFCFIAVLYSCKNETIVASVDDAVLTENDMYVLMRHMSSDPNKKEDRENFILWWTTNEAIKAEVMSKYPEEWHLAKLRSDAFTADLAKIILEEKLLVSGTDTLVTDNEVAAYYDEHKDEFVLQDYIVKALYFKIPAPVDYKKEGIQYAFLLKNDKDLMKVNSFAKLYAENYHFNDSSWVYFSEITKDIPVNKFNVDNLVLNRSKTYFSDEKYIYFINVIDFKLKDEAPPLEFLMNDIKNIIVAERIQNQIEKRRSKMIEQIKKNHEIIIH